MSWVVKPCRAYQVRFPLLSLWGSLGVNGCWVGDFNLAFLDLIKSVDGLKWSGNCNELNAAYSADGTLNLISVLSRDANGIGYSRVTNTIGCIVTTFG